MKPQSRDEFSLEGVKIAALVFKNEDYDKLADGFKMTGYECFSITHTKDTASFYRSQKIKKDRLIVVAPDEHKDQITRDEIKEAMISAQQVEGEMVADLYDARRIDPIVQRAPVAIKKYCKGWALRFATSQNVMRVAGGFLDGVPQVIGKKRQKQPEWWSRMMFEMSHHFQLMRQQHGGRELQRYIERILIYTCYLFVTLSKDPYARVHQ